MTGAERESWQAWVEGLEQAPNSSAKLTASPAAVTRKPDAKQLSTGAADTSSQGP